MKVERNHLILSLAVLIVACETKLVIPEDTSEDPPTTSDLIISEVRVTSTSEEGGFRNTYFEVYNGTGVDVNLSNYGAWYSSNGSNGVWDESTQITFDGTLTSGEVIVIARENTNPDLVVNPDYVWGELTANGDDGIALVKDAGSGFQVIDQYGEPYTSENDPGSAWSIAGVDEASRNTVLLRKYLVANPNTDWAQSAGTTTIGSEWVIRDKENYSNLGTFTPSGDAFEPEGPTPPPVDPGPSTNELIISEVRVTSVSEDGFRNTYVEIYNGTRATVDLSAYALQYASNGNSGDYDPTSQLTFTGSLENGAFIIVARDNTNPELVTNPDYTWSSLTANGDDAVGLFKDSGSGLELIDQYGELYTSANDPGSAWDIAGVADASKDFVLLRKFLVTDPNTDWPQSAGTTTVGSEWIVADKNDFSNLRTFTPDTVSFVPETPVEMPPMTNELVISEVRVTSVSEGGFRNTYLEVYNGTGSTVDLSNYGLQYASNGNNGVWDAGSQLTFTGTLDNEGHILIARDGTDPAIIVSPDYTWSALTANGDDAIALVKNNGCTFVVIDQYGEPYESADDPGVGWDIAGVANASRDNVLLRKFPIEDPNTNWTQSAGTTDIGSEWVVADKEDYSNIRTFTPDTVLFVAEEVTGPPPTIELIISEVRVTSSAEADGFRNTYFEIYNGTGLTVDLTNYGAWYSSNGSNGAWDASTQITFTGTLTSGDVIIVARTNTDPTLVVDPDFVWADLTANGDDGIALVKDEGCGFEVIDQYGEPYVGGGANDPGTAWDVAGVTDASRNTVLWRKYETNAPNTNWLESAGTSTTDSEWIVRDKEDYSNYKTFTPKQ